MKQQLYLIEMRDQRFVSYGMNMYIGTYTLSGNLINLNIRYYWTQHKDLITHKHLFGKTSEWVEGWVKETIKPKITLNQKDVYKITPLTVEELKEKGVIE